MRAGMIATLALALALGGCATSDVKKAMKVMGIEFHHYTGASPPEERVTVDEKRRRALSAAQRAEVEAQAEAQRRMWSEYARQLNEIQRRRSREAFRRSIEEDLRRADQQQGEQP